VIKINIMQYLEDALKSRKSIIFYSILIRRVNYFCRRHSAAHESPASDICVNAS